MANKRKNLEVQSPNPHDEGALSFEDFKKALGAAAQKYSDEQIEKMRRLCDGIGDAVFNDWLGEKKSA